MEELVSVIVPVYNVENHIKKCIDSIISQTYKNLEIILVDDGSTDKSGRICDEYAEINKRIKVIHKENGGLSDARNAGINIAKGTYITLVDSDDYIDKEYVEILYNTIIKENADIAITSHKVIYENKTTIEKATGEKTVLDPKAVLKRILYDDGIDLSACAKLYKTELFKNIKYPKGRLFEDAATTYKLIDSCDIIAINSKSTYNYIIREDSITNEKFSMKKMDLIKSTEEMSNYIKQKYPDLEKAANRRLLYAYFSTLTQLAKSKEKYPEQQQQILKYIKKNRRSVFFDSSTPKRDKFAIIASMFGFRAYKYFWKIYEKKMRRI